MTDRLTIKKRGSESFAAPGAGPSSRRGNNKMRSWWRFTSRMQTRSPASENRRHDDKTQLTKLDSHMARLHDSHLSTDIGRDFYRRSDEGKKAKQVSINDKLTSIDSADNSFYESGEAAMWLALNATNVFEGFELEGGDNVQQL